ncbi:MAG TPA: transcriptional regulator, partial [Salinarimonas sp.]|nr:transcriptional regulator [Salinarimonas sp.]
MPLSELLSPEAVLPSLRVSSKKQALQEIAAAAARLAGLDEAEVF